MRQRLPAYGRDHPIFYCDVFMNQSALIQPGGVEVPAIHALLIGVSDYPDLNEHEDDPAPDKHLGLRKLRSPALTVYRIHEWLERRRPFLPLPLASLRVLVSPSESELKVAPALSQWPERADLDNTVAAVEDWREKLARNPNNYRSLLFCWARREAPPEG